VLLEAPLQPNINHRSTVFGGSASAVAILAAWSQLHLGLVRAGVPARVVIQRNTMEYLQPIAGGFSARGLPPEPAEWQRFERTLARRGRARLSVGAELSYEGLPAGRLRGEFVALRA
jgi:thioesterase domain-containing protein